MAEFLLVVEDNFCTGSPDLGYQWVEHHPRLNCQHSKILHWDLISVPSSFFSNGIRTQVARFNDLL